MPDYILDPMTREPHPQQDLADGVAFNAWRRRTLTHTSEGERRAPWIVGHNILAPGVEVSTVFTGWDQNWSGEGPPDLWETLAFVDGEEHKMVYPTLETAQAGHLLMVQAILKLLADSPSAADREG